MLVKFLFQLCVNVRLFSQGAPDQEAHSDHTEGHHFPPGAFMLAPQRTVHLPSPVAGLADGETNGLIVDLLLGVFSRLFGLGQQTDLGLLMAKDKSKQKPPKREKFPPRDDEVCVEQTKKSKRKRLEVEEAPVQIPDITLTVEEDQNTKVKERKKKQKKGQTETTMQIEISDPADAPEGEEDLSPEERRVLERKMKKIWKKEEKRRLKAEGISSPKNEESGPTASQQALDYLNCWAHNRAGWKFQKTRQTWLLQNMFDSEQIQDEKFSALLQYLEGLRGGSRDTTVQKALVLVQESGRAPEDGDVQKRARRAREVIQMLS
ncbi:uncharacterized protein C7orf50 homolog isoform X2 [Phycodurus eques]|uniref:uncharacterized protein C7orf50 homolog isoform X2 n=1 Tax=Phycodurus eques TaxID=693459 RepID=UPI002ACD7146|nr:uncharacterized protein C7orf50 homolog isoform X2 [Phycodurus eques]